MIPHTDKSDIATNALLKRRIEVLESLANITAGQSISADASKAASAGVNRLDLAYRQLKLTMTPLERFTSEFDS
jgi:LDH2 family malate/lactate/ureidoglycolate dehydrogenase